MLEWAGLNSNFRLRRPRSKQLLKKVYYDHSCGGQLACQNPDSNPFAERTLTLVTLHMRCCTRVVNRKRTEHMPSIAHTKQLTGRASTANAGFFAATAVLQRYRRWWAARRT